MDRPFRRLEYRDIRNLHRTGRPVEATAQAATKLADPLDADRLSELDARTRYDAAEVEGRIFAAWMEAGYFHPEPEGTAGGELLDRDPAAERDRRRCTWATR